MAVTTVSMQYSKVNFYWIL